MLDEQKRQLSTALSRASPAAQHRHAPPAAQHRALPAKHRQLVANDDNGTVGAVEAAVANDAGAPSDEADGVSWAPGAWSTATLID